jgi:putative ABC transport system permease protein
MFFRPLPWEYGVRNLWRRPGRSALTMLGLATVVFLVLLVTAFVRGLEASLAKSGDTQVVLVHSLGAAENIENSTMPGRSSSLLAASLKRIESRFGERYVSPELYLGSEVTTAGSTAPSRRLAR